jgi:hypothetical protein
MLTRPFPRVPSRWLAAALAVAGFAVLVPAAYSAPPPNDAFAAATEIAGTAGSIGGANTEATKEPGEPNHGDNAGGHSVWYRWIAPLSGSVLMDTCTASFDTLLAAYQGATVAGLTMLASDDDSCDTGSRIAFQVTSGQEYRIAVDGFDGVVGTFTLRWQALTAASNDAFASAQPISGASGQASGTNFGATSEAGEPRHVDGAGGQSIWYSWTAPSSATATFNTCGSTFDTVLAVYTGNAVNSLTAVGRNDDGASCPDGTEDRSFVAFPTAAGTTYRIAVDGFEQSAGAVTLNWVLRTAPANDPFARARTIRGARGRVAGTNFGATRQSGEAQHGGTGTASVWYRWRAPRTMRVAFATCGATFDSLLGFYRGTRLTSLRALARNDDGCSRGLGSRVQVSVRRGTVYHIAVDGLGQSFGRFTLTWGVAPCVVPRVVGERLTRATALIRAGGCRVGRVSQVASSLVARGRVIAQAPAPGRRLASGARVHLEVSRGRR